MATDLVMPQLPAYPQQQTQQQQQQQRFYSSPQKQQKNAFRAQPQLAYQPAPLPTPYPSATNKTQISPLSTSGSSQTSPKNYTAREESKPYIPAVLRRNEFPPINISTEAELVMQERSDEQPLRPNSSFMSLGGLGALGRLSRRSTGDSAKHVDGSWNLDLFPEPTGAPTRKNWKPDSESIICDDARCKKYFGYFTRRHHCRKCGHIFCDTHSNYEVPLDQDANYNPRGAMSRACAYCYMEFQEWRSRTNSQSSRGSSSDGSTKGGNLAQSNTGPVVGSSPIVSVGNGLMFAPSRAAEIAHSVPRDWNWSTF
ncbi:vacuolar segregation protein pep7 [Cladorrhinum samala]|uniref:Vacuolar segregation protein pep7 n=1 Tax=Cladorrhinum samala TaxID=585594 RepID=A0AAV9HNA2_9PEZI|nr:vacuolar segregation protein pep7 [Cladorrhinum samala]